jgi:hypothetical protein
MEFRTSDRSAGVDPWMWVSGSFSAPHGSSGFFLSGSDLPFSLSLSLGLTLSLILSMSLSRWVCVLGREDERKGKKEEEERKGGA